MLVCTIALLAVGSVIIASKRTSCRSGLVNVVNRIKAGHTTSASILGTERQYAPLTPMEGRFARDGLSIELPKGETILKSERDGLFLGIRAAHARISIIGPLSASEWTDSFPLTTFYLGLPSCCEEALTLSKAELRQNPLSWYRTVLESRLPLVQRDMTNESVIRAGIKAIGSNACGWSVGATEDCEYILHWGTAGNRGGKWFQVAVIGDDETAARAWLDVLVRSLRAD